LPLEAPLLDVGDGFLDGRGVVAHTGGVEVLISSAVIWPSGEDCKAREDARVGDAELCGHEASGAEARDCDC